MRLDGLGKPPLAQASSDNIDQSKVRTLKTREVKETARPSGAGPSDAQSEAGGERLGKILDLLRKAKESGKDNKKKKNHKKTVLDAMRAYQRMAEIEAEGHIGQILDRKI